MKDAVQKLNLELIFSTAHAFEQATDWHKQRPKIAIQN
jgi:hypothetical protein